MFNIKNRFSPLFYTKPLSFTTTLNIALTVIIITFMLIFLYNVNYLLKDWRDGLRIIAYVDDSASKKDILSLQDKIEKTEGVSKANLLSKEKALEVIKEEFKDKSSFFETLDTNFLPNAFEIFLFSNPGDKKIKLIADKILSLELIEDVEYGKAWIEYFFKIFKLIKIISIVVALFFIISCIFIVINTFHLSFFLRKKEIEVMNLIGASTLFIGRTFYKQATIQGFVGGLLGSIFTLVFFYTLKFWLIKNGIITIYSRLNLLPLYVFPIILFFSSLIGFLGCYFSLKYFLKR